MAFSYGDAAGGGLQGASAGLAIGGPLGAAVGGLAGGVLSGALGGKSRAAAKQAARAQRRIAAMSAFREKVAAQNNYDAQRAEAVAGAASEGRMGDSATVGALGAFATQQNAAFGFTNAVEKQLSIARRAAAKSARYADYNQIGGQLIGAAGSLFKGALTSPAATPADPYSADKFNLQEPAAPSFFSGQGLSFFIQP